MYVRLIAALVIIAALTGTYFWIHHDGVVTGRSEIQAQWDAQKVADNAAKEKAISDRLTENELLRTKYAAEATRRNIDHEKELAAVNSKLRDSINKRVPIGANFCRPTPAREGETPSPGPTGETVAGTAFLPDAFANDLRQLAADADQAVADARTVYQSIQSAGCFQ